MTKTEDSEQPEKRGPGRPRKADAGVWHLARPDVNSRKPLLVTLRVRAHVPDLGGAAYARAIRRAIVFGSARFGARISRWSIERDRIRLFVEAPDRESLSRTMHGLGVRVAKAINGVLGKHGKIFDDRYEVRVLDPDAARRAQSELRDGE